MSAEIVASQLSRSLWAKNYITLAGTLLAVTLPEKRRGSRGFLPVTGLPPNNDSGQCTSGHQ